MRNNADKIIMDATQVYVGKRINIVTGAVPRLSAPVLLSANHPTTLDPLLLQFALKLPCSALLTQVVFSIPLVRTLLSAARQLPVGERGEGGKPLIEAAAEIARSGRPLAIFPEGCLSPGPELAPLRSGAVRIAATARIPIVPVGIAVSGEGIREISWPFGEKPQTGRYLFHGWYVLRAGKPLLFDIEPEDRQAVNQCTARLAASMRELGAEARGILAFLEGREDAPLYERGGLDRAVS
jgi:1-acyl-sn-glycerol-3-phosphate acyltransferase